MLDLSIYELLSVWFDKILPTRCPVGENEKFLYFCGFKSGPLKLSARLLILNLMSLIQVTKLNYFIKHFNKSIIIIIFFFTVE